MHIDRVSLLLLQVHVSRVDSFSNWISLKHIDILDAVTHYLRTGIPLREMISAGLAFEATVAFQPEGGEMMTGTEEFRP